MDFSTLFLFAFSFFYCFFVLGRLRFLNSRSPQKITACKISARLVLYTSLLSSKYSKKSIFWTFLLTKFPKSSKKVKKKILFHARGSPKHIKSQVSHPQQPRRWPFFWIWITFSTFFKTFLRFSSFLCFFLILGVLWRSFWKKVAKHRLQSGAQGTGQKVNRCFSFWMLTQRSWDLRNRA